MTEEMLKAQALLAATAEYFRQAGAATDLMRSGLDTKDPRALHVGGVLIMTAVSAAYDAMTEAQRLLKINAEAARSVEALLAQPVKGAPIQ